MDSSKSIVIFFPGNKKTRTGTPEISMEFKSHRIHGTGIFIDISLIFYGKCRYSRYTIPMDGTGWCSSSGHVFCASGDALGETWCGVFWSIDELLSKGIAMADGLGNFERNAKRQWTKCVSWWKLQIVGLWIEYDWTDVMLLWHGSGKEHFITHAICGNGIFTYIYHKKHRPNVGKNNTMHGSYD